MTLHSVAKRGETGTFQSRQRAWIFPISPVLRLSQETKGEQDMGDKFHCGLLSVVALEQRCRSWCYLGCFPFP